MPAILSMSNRFFVSPCTILDRKSTRLNSSHGYTSYAVFCLKKKNLSTCIPVFTSSKPNPPSDPCMDSIDPALAELTIQHARLAMPPSSEHAAADTTSNGEPA